MVKFHPTKFTQRHRPFSGHHDEPQPSRIPPKMSERFVGIDEFFSLSGEMTAALRAAPGKYQKLPGLQLMSYSSPRDVCAFGVVLLEVFGAVPFNYVNSWTGYNWGIVRQPNFSQYLNHDKRCPITRFWILNDQKPDLSFPEIADVWEGMIPELKENVAALQDEQPDLPYRPWG